MARRQTDLLDVFRSQPAPPARKAAPSAPSGPKRSFEGLFLFPRQLMLGSCVVVLLLVFTFVLGLSVGKRGSESNARALQGATARPGVSPAFYVLGRVPYVDSARQARNDPSALRDRLATTYTVDADGLWIGDDAAAKQWVLILGPFANEQQALEYLVRHRLLKARLGSGTPFERPVYRRMLPSELPTQRIPER